MAKDRSKVTDLKRIRQGLFIYKRGASPYWYCRIWDPVKKSYRTRSTKETVRVEAIKTAEELFNATPAPSREELVAARQMTFEHFASKLIGQRYDGKYVSRDENKILLRKVDGLIPYFGKKDISTITTADLKNYLQHLDERRDQPLAQSTKHKHVIILRKVFTVAVDEGKINAIPVMPKIKVEDQPRSSFTQAEFKILIEQADQMAKDEYKVKSATVTKELVWLIGFTTTAFLRPTVSELMGVRHVDIKQLSDPERLEISLKGKTGWRTTTTMPAAKFIYQQMLKLRPVFKPTDYVFYPDVDGRENALALARRLFNAVLSEANLKLDKDGKNRSLYSLRHYSLQNRLNTSGGAVNPYILAKTAGTSVEILERFYLKNLPITAEQAENLQMMRKKKKPTKKDQ